MLQLEKEKWEQWNKNGGPAYPHEKLIQFMFRNYPKETRPNVKVLDLGCGSGANTVFLCKENFKVCGTDISDAGINNTRSKLDANSLKPESLKVEPISTISYPDNYFDCIVSIGVFDAAGKSETIQAIKEVYRVLKNSGKGLFIFASNEDFRIKNKILDLYGYNFDELNDMFRTASFEKIWIDSYKTSYENNSYIQSDFIVTVFK
jgi:ubiquinone/menaquinone biosynthesis C-methylase UbiE